MPGLYKSPARIMDRQEETFRLVEIEESQVLGCVESAKGVVIIAT